MTNAGQASLIKVLGLIAFFALGAAAQTERLPLRGVAKVAVEISLTGDDLPFGLTKERLQQMTELRLRTVGLKVLSAEENAKDPDIVPSVDVNVIILRAASVGGVKTGWAFSTNVQVTDYGLSPRNSALISMVLWNGGGQLILTGPDPGNTEVQRVVGELLDRMLNDWLKANPK